MRGRAPVVRVLPEGRYSITLKAKVILVGGNLNDLLWDMFVYRYVLQKVVDALWELDKLPTLNQCHQMFYKTLRECYGFRAHVAKQLYRYALALVKATKSNGGSKPIIKKMSVRLDRYDARIDLENMVVEIVIREKRYRLRILHDPNYVKKFLGRKWYEIVVKYERGSLWISIPFEFDYRPYRSRNAIAIDINLRQLTLYDGRKVRRVSTRFIEALSLKAYAEELQRKYPKRWRYNLRILNRIRALHRRSRNIVVDWCRKFAKYVVLKALRSRSAVALENLERLWQARSQSGSKLAWKLSRFAYRKLQLAIITKAIEYNVPIIFVDPRNTSKTCPRCDSELRYWHRLGICPVCGYKRDRDTIGAINIYQRALKGMRGAHGCSPSAPAMNDETRGSGRTRVSR